MIGSLIQYGLLNKMDKGELSVSDLAVKILYPENNDEYENALEQSAMLPKVFSELREYYSSSLPSEKAIEVYLKRRSFSDFSIPLVTKAFLKTDALLENNRANKKTVSSYSDPLESSYDNTSNEDETIMNPTQLTNNHNTYSHNHQASFDRNNPVKDNNSPHSYTSNETLWIQNKIGKSTTIKLISIGNIGPNEINNLIKLLEIQRDILNIADDDAEKEDNT